MTSITQTETTTVLFNSLRRLENNYDDIRFGLYRDTVIANIAWHLLKLRDGSVDKSFGYTDHILFNYTSSAKTPNSEFREQDESYIDLTILNLKSNKSIFGNSSDLWADVKTFFEKHEKINIDVQNQFEFQGNYNPLNVTDSSFLGEFHQINDLHKLFAKDLYNHTKNVQNYFGQITKREVKELITYYTFDLLIEYKRKALNILPDLIVKQVIAQVMKACNLVFTIFDSSLEASVLEEINLSLKNRDIELVTISYFEQIS